jgi:hypothetical protein
MKKIYPINENLIFFVIACHSYAVIKKQAIKKNIKKNEPLIIKKSANGINKIELSILL